MDGALKEYLHTPVLTKEVIEYLRCSMGGTFVDGTVGEGGHALQMLRASKKSRVVGIDRDEEILGAARKRLAGYAGRVFLIHDDFVHLPHILRRIGIKTVDGVLLDLGVSTFHLQKEGRGFSFQKEGPLDMRMDRRSDLTAHHIVNHFPLKEVEEILNRYGEERWAKKIAKAIGKQRQHGSIETTTELAEVTSRAIPRHFHPRRLHPATKTFLALRIAVNEELKKIEEAMKEIPPLLRRGGRICVISFQSLEDRIVKEAFKTMERTCICSPVIPKCVCGGREKVLDVITPKPLTPGPKEKSNNPRARSAKLRVAERV